MHGFRNMVKSGERGGAALCVWFQALRVRFQALRVRGRGGMCSCMGGYTNAGTRGQAGA